MSRIGKHPITVPSGVTITVENNVVTVKGPKGQLSEKVSPRMNITEEDGTLKVARPTDEKQDRALHGLTRTLINNMVLGVTNGFEKKLEIEVTRLPRAATSSFLQSVTPITLSLRRRTASLSTCPLPTGSPLRVSASRRSARSLRTSARFVLPSPIRARASAMPVSSYAVRSARRVSNWR